MLVESSCSCRCSRRRREHQSHECFTKRWPVQSYIELIQRLQLERSCRVILVGGPGDQGNYKPVLFRYLSGLPIDATDLSFGDMASVFRRCNLFIGNDSAPHHIAASMGIPCIGIFGPTNPHQWSPLDQEQQCSLSNPSNATLVLSMKHFQSAHTFVA